MPVAVIGIDLGTARTRVAIWKDGDAKIIPDADGGDSFASIIACDFRNDKLVTGPEAEIMRSPTIVNDIKREMGTRPYACYNRNARRIKHGNRAAAAFVWFVAIILNRVMSNVATHLESNLKSMTIQAVVSVPALFNEQQRQIIRDAAKIVGIDVLSLISSSSAVCYAWAQRNRREDDLKIHTLALDMGAGYFQAAVAGIVGDVVKMKSIHHKTMAGYDLERVLYKYLKRVAKEGAIFVRENSSAAFRLYQACRDTIVQLSYVRQYHLVLESLADDKTFDTHVHRSTLYELATQTLLPMSFTAIDHVLHHSGVAKGNIQKLLISGDCLRVRILRRVWAAYLDNRRRTPVLKDAEVSGCALHAAFLVGAHSSKPDTYNLGRLLENIPFSIGVGLPSGECYMIMPKNKVVPYSKTKVLIWDNSVGLVHDPSFSTLDETTPKDSTDKTEVDKFLYFYQGKSSHCHKNLLLMKFDLTDVLAESPNLQKQKLRIGIDLDAKSRIEFSVTSEQGKTVSKRLSPKSVGLTTHECKSLRALMKYLNGPRKLKRNPNAKRHPYAQRQRKIETFNGLRSPSHTSLLLHKHTSSAALRSNFHQPASIREQRAISTEPEAHTELVLQVPEQTVERIGDKFTKLSLIAEQVADAPLELGDKHVQGYAYSNLRNEGITITPGTDHPLVDNSSHETGDDDILHPTNKQSQDEVANSRSRGQRVHNTPSFYKNAVKNPSVCTLVDLESLFSASSRDTRGVYTDTNFARVSVYLRNKGHASWSATPRLYTALRLIDNVDTLNEFLKKGMNDMCFPFTNATVPGSISPTIKSAFLEIQGTVYLESKSYSVGHGRHVYFSKDDPKPFQIIALLGKGGHGTVDKVMNKLDQKEYARKLFRRGRSWSQGHIESFRTEVNVLKRVVHAHCVQLIGTYSDPRYFAILMIPAGDCNLARYYELAQDNNDKLSLLRSFLGCLTSGVRYLHDSKIRHRDIKPQNVIIKDDQVYLTDFGIAYSWTSIAGATTTADSGKTAIYAAPEVIRVEPRNTAADIWSLGCIFFEISTILYGGSVEGLKAYFRQKNDTECYHANVDNFPAWVNGLRPGSARNSDRFSWKLARMALHVDASKRPTATELFEEIVEETNRTGVHFCGPCCSEGDISTSESETDWPSAGEGNRHVG